MQDVFFRAEKNRVAGVVAAGVADDEFSVSTSMILPLPSSPHWAPTRIVFAIN
jgi:hypothetical protein